MGPLFFNNWMLLGGLLALAIPILIHLLLKRRPLRLRFSTLRFFREQDDRARRRRRLRNLVLLGLRMLLLALLVFAFARPYWMDAAEREEPDRRYQVFVVDQSASMRMSDYWSRTTGFITEQLSGLTENDRVALVTCGERTEVASDWSPPGRLLSLINGDELTPGLGGATLADGLIEASGLLANRESAGDASVILLSDLQVQSCENLSRVKLPPEVELRIEHLSKPGLENVALTALLPVAPGAFEVRLQNRPDASRRTVAVELLVNDKHEAVAMVSLDPGTETNLVLTAGALTVGPHQIVARIRQSDALADDDARYLVHETPAPAVVWCLQPPRSGSEFQEETFYLRHALDPAVESHAASFEVKLVAPDGVGARLQRENPAAIFVPALGTIPSDLPAALERQIQSGGAVVFFLGGAVRAERYNSAFERLFPATLLRVEGDDDQPEGFWNLARDQPRGDLFRVFEGPGNGDVSRPVFRKRFVLVPAEGAEAPALFGDGKPFAVAKERGRGRVWLINTSADTEWGDWPKRRTFVPWVHGLAGVTTGRTLWPRKDSTGGVAGGGPLLFETGNTLVGREVSIRTPKREIRTTVPDAHGKATIIPDEYGIYALLDPDGAPVEQLAANFPSEESDHRTLSPADVQRTIQRETVRESGVLAAMVNADRQELWKAVLLTGLVLLIAESLLSNRTWA